MLVETFMMMALQAYLLTVEIKEVMVIVEVLVVEVIM